MLNIAIALAGTTVAAWTDLRTGYVPDWLSHAMIVAGIALAPILFPTNLVYVYGVAGLTFAALFGMYAFGQMGGGDVKLFTALALLLPVHSAELSAGLGLRPVAAPYPFIFSLFVTFGVIYMAVISTVYLRRVWAIRHRIADFSRKAGRGFVFALALLPLLLLWLSLSRGFALLIIPLMLALAIIPFKEDIVKHFFAQRKAVAALNEDDVLALELIDARTKKALGLWRKTFLGPELVAIKRRARAARIRTVLVCENMPRAVPYILASLAANLALGDALLFALLNLA